MWSSFRPGEGHGPWFGGDDSRPERGPEPAREDLSGCGLTLFLASLTMLFGAALIGAVMVRSGARGDGWTLDLARTFGLTAATLMLWRADRALSSPSSGARAALLRASGFGALFLAAQAWNWWSLARDGLGPGSGGIASVVFYLLTGLHASHLIGGVVALLWVARRTGDGGTVEAARLSRGLQLCRRYWRYLAIVWLVLLVPLLLF